jgi:hypothetical protein
MTITKSPLVNPSGLRFFSRPAHAADLPAHDERLIEKSLM